MSTNGSSSANGVVGSRKPGEPRVGICILKVEEQADYLLITVTTNRHIGRGLTFAQPDSISRYARPADALRAAELFLGSFT